MHDIAMGVVGVRLLVHSYTVSIVSISAFNGLSISGGLVLPATILIEQWYRKDNQSLFFTFVW